MGYETIIRNAISGILSPQFESMKLNVTHTAWIADDGRGNDSFAAPVVRRALVSLRRKQQFTSSGVLVMTVATILFIDPVPNNGAAGRQEPIDTRDNMVLPDGTTAPIVEVGGFADSGTNQPFAIKVVLGTPVRGS